MAGNILKRTLRNVVSNSNEFNYEGWVTAGEDFEHMKVVCYEVVPEIDDRLTDLEQKVQEIIETGGLESVKVVANYESLPVPGETEVIYITKNNSNMYYYDGRYILLSTASDSSVISYESWEDFPGVGKADTLYIDRSTDTVYYFNTDTSEGGQIGWTKINNYNVIQCEL